MSCRIFISHSSYDSEFALALYAFLQDGFEINSSDIFCTSKQDELIVGSDPHTAILDALKGTDEICYFIISPSTFDSMYCFCEMGAAWALDKDPTLIHIYPITHDDVRLRRLPFSQRWAIDVNLILDDSIRNMAESIRCKLKNKNIQERANFIGKRDRFVNEVIEITRRKETMIDMKDSSVFHKNGDDKTLIKLNSTDNSAYLTYDFNTSKPDYVGYAVELEKSDWSVHIKNEHSLMFDTEVSHQLTINLELKGENKVVLTTEKIQLSPVVEHKAIKLSELNVKFNKWHAMTQLVFLIKPDELADIHGILKISNLRLGQTTI